MNIQKGAFLRIVSVFIIIGLTILLSLVAQGEQSAEALQTLKSDENVLQEELAPIQVGKFEDIQINILYEEESGWQ